MRAVAAVLISLPAYFGMVFQRGDSLMSRRVAIALAPSALIAVPALVRAADDEKALVAELKDCAERLKPINAMLDKEQWDTARTILKSPPVANLWNLGNSKNTIRKLAAVRNNDVELIEYVESVASALQLADQFIYDNTFVYEQPGNGKFYTKEPKASVKTAMKLLNEMIALCE